MRPSAPAPRRVRLEGSGTALTRMVTSADSMRSSRTNPVPVIVSSVPGASDALTVVTNHRRPHGSLGYQAPAEHAATWIKPGVASLLPVNPATPSRPALSWLLDQNSWVGRLERGRSASRGRLRSAGSAALEHGAERRSAREGRC